MACSLSEPAVCALTCVFVVTVCVTGSAQTQSTWLLSVLSTGHKYYSRRQGFTSCPTCFVSSVMHNFHIFSQLRLMFLYKLCMKRFLPGMNRSDYPYYTWALNIADHIESLINKLYSSPGLWWGDLYHSFIRRDSNIAVFKNITKKYFLIDLNSTLKQYNCITTVTAYNIYICHQYQIQLFASVSDRYLISSSDR